MRGSWRGQLTRPMLPRPIQVMRSLAIVGGGVCGEKREIGRDGWIVGIVVKWDSEAGGESWIKYR